MRHILSLALLTLASNLSAALPGVPESPGAMLDSAWATLSNDSWALPHGPDDNRTSEAVVGFHAASYVFVIDNSMLTAIGARPSTRLDELTATVGTDVLSGRELTVTLGAGVTARGNLGGEIIQDRFHAGTHSGVQFHVGFDGGSVSPLVYGLVAGRSGPENLFALYSVSGSATADGELLADIFAGVGTHQLADAEFDASVLYVGLREQLRYSRLDSPTVKRVFDYENGLWVEVGFTYWHLEFTDRVSIQRRQGVAAITYRF